MNQSVPSEGEIPKHTQAIQKEDLQVEWEHSQKLILIPVQPVIT